MKKYGKYEKRPEGVPAKQPKVKSALLQTYFTSLLCMVLCVTMFFGTSYAWFTSEVSNTDNEIYIGTLDVGLFKENGTANPDDLADNDKKLFDSNIRWEPGYTALETIQVVNKGDLAFKYTLDFTDGSGNDSAADDLTAEQLAAVSANFEVWVYNHQNTDYTYKKPNAYEEITEANGWVNVGTLDEILGDKVVLQDKVMKTVRLDDLAEGATTPTIAGTDRVATTDRYTIALHMKESTKTDVMGYKIMLSVKLIAYQMGSELDAFGSQYDKMVASAEGLKEALESGGTVALAANIDLSTTQINIPTDKTAILDLNGHAITGTVSEPVSLITNNGNLTIKGEGSISVNCTGTAGEDKAFNAISNRGVLTVNGGKISSIGAQNPSANKATEVKGTVILNGGEVTTTYYENYTTVKVKAGVTATVTGYGAGSDNTTTEEADGYTVYSFVH